MNKIRIEGSSPVGKNYRVFINGVEINNLIGIDVHIPFLEPVVVTLKIKGEVEFVDEIETEAKQEYKERRLYAPIPISDSMAEEIEEDARHIANSGIIYQQTAWGHNEPPALG